MFHGRTTTHICTLRDRSSKSFLPTLSSWSNRFDRLQRFIKKWILVAEANPHSVYFYRDSAKIIDERRAHAASGNWIIHPFSMFRLYYEMWMTVVFFLCLIHMPLYASYSKLLGRKLDISHYVLCSFSLVDIFITFRTGMHVSNEKILMENTDVARHYIFGRHFICDVLSSMPVVMWVNPDKKTIEICSFCWLLKIVRLPTFLRYLGRTFNYFRVPEFTILMIKLWTVGLLVLHFLTCFTYCMYLFIDYTNDVPSVGQHQYNVTEFLRSYARNCYFSGSLLLDVDVTYDYETNWRFYLFTVFGYIIGKVLVTILIVVLLDIWKLKDLLENKYYSMMNQVSDFMSACHLPMNIQDKIEQTYYHHYRGKFINETRIKRYISEKLRKEIKYQDCRKLIHSVKMFVNLPQEIVENILPYLKIEIFLAKDIILKAGTSGDCMYFLEAGTVAVMSPSGKEICHLQDGDYFGELCLLGSRIRNATILALETCSLYKLEKKYFQKCVEDYPQVYKVLKREAKRRITETLDVERVLQTKLH